MKRVLPVVLVCFSLMGCADPYGASSKASADIAAAINSGLTTVQGLQQQKTLSNQETLNVLGYLEFANHANEAFQSCISVAHTNGNAIGTYTACATTFNTALNNTDDLALIKVSSSTATQTISTIVNSLTTATQAIITGLKGA